jgi:hypothetical protein
MCVALTTKGKLCKSKATSSGYCKRHSPEYSDGSRTYIDELLDIVQLQRLTITRFENEKIIIPKEMLFKLQPDSEFGVAFEEPNNNVKYIIIHGDRYRALVDSSNILKSVVNRDSVNTIMISTDHDDKIKLKEAHKIQIVKMELKLEQQKNRYSKIHGLYTQSINQIVDMKRKLTESNTEVNSLQQNKREFKAESNIKQCLMDFSILDGFIKESIYNSTGMIRSKYKTCGVDDFLTLPNIKNIMKELNISTEGFKNKYNTARTHRIAVAHPATANLSKATIRATLSEIIT